VWWVLGTTTYTTTYTVLCELCVSLLVCRVLPDPWCLCYRHLRSAHVPGLPLCSTDAQHLRHYACCTWFITTSTVYTVLCELRVSLLVVYVPPTTCQLRGTWNMTCVRIHVCVAVSSRHPCLILLSLLHATLSYSSIIPTRVGIATTAKCGAAGNPH